MTRVLTALACLAIASCSGPRSGDHSPQNITGAAIQTQIRTEVQAALNQKVEEAGRDIIRQVEPKMAGILSWGLAVCLVLTVATVCISFLLYLVLHRFGLMRRLFDGLKGKTGVR